MDSAEGYFSLGIMVKEGEGGPVDIPLAVQYMARAASLGNIRAMNYLAHALWDPESWLGEHERARDRHKTGSRGYAGSSSHSEPVQIFLSDAQVISLPEPLAVCPSCVLPLFKHLAEHCAGINGKKRIVMIMKLTLSQCYYR